MAVFLIQPLNLLPPSRIHGQDGKRLLMVKPIEEARAPREINVVVNWLEELKR